MDAKLQKWVKKNIWNTEKRSGNMTIAGKFWENVFGSDNFSEEVVTEKRAHQLATVYTCLNIRSQTISAIPANVMQEKNGKKEVLTDHEAYYPLAHQPNGYMSSANFFLTSMIHADSWGNSYSRINRDFRLRPLSFDLMCPWDVSTVIQDGQAFYRYDGEMIPSRDVLHFRWFSYNGLDGISPIRLNASTMGMAIKEDRYSTMALGQKPPGILSYEGDLKAEQRAQNQKAWKEDLRMGNTPVLSGRWKFDPIMISPGEADYIAQKKLTKQEIYGIYRIPPTFAQDFERATFANAEQQDLVFVKHTVVPIIRVIEQECNMKLFTEREKKNTYVKFNLNGLLRGDLTARQAFYQAMVNTGVYNRNEVRSLEDLNPYQGGEEFLVQGAMAPADMLREIYKSKVLPTAKPPATERVNGFYHN